MKLIPIFLPENSCPFRCTFCNVQIANGENAAIHSPGDVQLAIETALVTLGKRHSGETVEIAFFGGTFTAGNPELVRDYLTACAPFLGNNVISGIRVSTRPDCVTNRILNLLKEYGVTSVELGVESFDDNVLNRLNRCYSAKTAIHAVQQLQRYGFTTGIHLMAGCPGESEYSFRQSIQTTLEIHPDTVRLHPLLVLANTPLAEQGYIAPDCEDILERLALATYCLARNEIPVIRLGLQATDSLNRPGHILSGCYHAALRHRVMSRIYRQFLNQTPLPPDSEIFLSTRHFSYGIGFKRENANLFPRLIFRKDDSIRQWDVLVNGTCYHILTEGLYEIDENSER